MSKKNQVKVFVERFHILVGKIEDIDDGILKKDLNNLNQATLGALNVALSKKIDGKQ